MAAGSQKWFRIGRLPGDIYYQKPGFSFFFPITSMILCSLVLSAILWLVSLFRR